MAKSGSFFESKAFKVVMSKVYGLGASVVIIGALFKLEHWPFASTVLIVGLCTEAIIFALSAFEPPKEELDWTLVYPELAGMEGKDNKKDKKQSLAGELDKALEDAKIEPELIHKVGDGLRNLSDNANKMSDISDAAVATGEYADKIKQASGNVDKLNEQYNKVVDAMGTLVESSDASKEYFDQMKEASQKLQSLNSVYEMELEETNNHIKALNQYYDNLTKTIDNISGTQEETAQLKAEFNKLNQNLTSLNSVYGNMLTAMGASKSAE